MQFETNSSLPKQASLRKDILCPMSFDVIDKKFCKWYLMNKTEQAGQNTTNDKFYIVAIQRQNTEEVHAEKKKLIYRPEGKKNGELCSHVTVLYIFVLKIYHFHKSFATLDKPPFENTSNGSFTTMGLAPISFPIDDGFLICNSIFHILEDN